MTRICTKCGIYTNHKKRVLSRYCANCVKSELLRIFLFRRNHPKFTFQSWLKYYVDREARKSEKGRKQNAV